MLDDDYRIPVLIRIEPERLINQIGEDRDIGEHISDLLNRGLRGSLKTGNFGHRGVVCRYGLLSKSATNDGYP